ncbi:alpha/beta fold hydrolase [Shewanella sp. NIFS-20-20]|uniref:alpha/beta fold hydrolase n=1 Tax=Shewanella sp. NIFS-20-20 TaxID=2853806 RepID=UPI001C44B658|nr:alpha/beta fold hydrolase [Shewanella sp. NIFS-20-20]MBV7315201.1 alpha/beta fold hydrolase [Shewanella sp. NIFS-20-20]
MHFQVSGAGNDVILIHGLFGSLDNLSNLSRSLSQHYRVFRVDVANHGDSPRLSPMNYPNLVQQLLNFMDSQGLGSAALVGHSMGGKIAMATALSAPERVAALVVADIAPVAYSPRHLHILDSLARLPLTELTSRQHAGQLLNQAGIDEGMVQFLLKNLRRNDAGFSWKMDLETMTRDYPEIIGWPYQGQSYLGPCIFIRGGDSDYVQEHHRQAIISQFPAVQAKSILATGHWLHAQKPEAFNRLVMRFLNDFYHKR